MTQPKPTAGRTSPWELAVGPPPEQWDHWTELDPAAWPQRKEKHFRCVPTICFNCESGCGLLAFVDKDSGEVEKFEGNPVHPGSRGRTCAKGPATLNQIQAKDRILTPLKRSGPRGSGEFVRATWKEALEDIGGRIRKAIDEERQEEVMYHVGRPGDDHFVARMLHAWGVDGHNSHTNVCSSSARTGFYLWCGADRPSPDYSETKFMLLLSAHLETGHYFNPHAQRIVEAKERGARLAVIDTRLSNTASRADHWIATWPGSEAAMLLGIARELLERDAIDHEYLRRWCNWSEYVSSIAPELEGADEDARYAKFIELLKALYAGYTEDFVSEECRVPRGVIETLTDEIVAAEGKFSSYLWRNAASGNLGGWQIARCLLLLHVLTGSFGTPGGFGPNSWDKFVPKPSTMPPAHGRWSELLWPREYPLAHYEMSILLPQLLKDQGRRLEVYFTRVYNPVWTNPNGGAWIRMFEDEEAMGCHVALTPTWSETAQWADWVLPMGLGSERHDLMSQETHAGTWLGFRQPVQREFQRLEGKDPQSTLGTNPGEVWEEAEFWIALSHQIDPDGSRGIRKYYESPTKPGAPVSLDEYYADIFENSVPGLPEAAAAQGMAPLEYMRRYGAFDVPYAGKKRFEAEVGADEPGIDQPDGRRAGLPTPSRLLEFYSKTLVEYGFGQHAVPDYIRSHVHWRELDAAKGEMVLLPTFRLPTLIHTRSGNAKWLNEISHTNPLWTHPEDAARIGLENGGLARVETASGYFVLRTWITEGIHPGVVACSHHVGRWRLHREIGGQSHSSALVDMSREGDILRLRQKEGAGALPKGDPDAERVWWREVGVCQNLTFPVQPDPVSGMQCWHQKVTVRPAQEGDRYGDIEVDLAKAEAVTRSWMEATQPRQPGQLRRPLWLKRPIKPTAAAYEIPAEG